MCPHDQQMQMHQQMKSALCLYGLLLVLPFSCFAALYQANPSNYRALISGLKPGDTLMLAAGIYPDGLPLSNLQGASSAEILISGPTSGSPAVFTGRACCNTVQIKDSSYIRIQYLRLDGQNISGIDGVNGRGVTHHITLDHLVIVGHGADQQTIGISTKGPAWNWLIRENVIEGAGTGMYLGNSDGSFPFVAGVIENNLVFDTIGYNIEIKHQLPRPANIGMPGGVNKTIIRNNVFSKWHNASTGSLARPNLLVGHFPLAGTGSQDFYEIYGNFFYQNPSEALFQGEGNIAMYSNLLLNDSGDAINIQPHNDVPREIQVFHNTVVARDSGIRVKGGAPGYVQSVFSNAVLAGLPITAPLQLENITNSYNNAAQYLIDPQGAPGVLNLAPIPGKLTATAPNPGTSRLFTEADRDFDGVQFRTSDRGAYADDGHKPFWVPQLAIKPPRTVPAKPVIGGIVIKPGN